MNTKKQGREPVYDSNLKITVAREYLTGNLGYGGLTKKYGLFSIETARHFVRWYKKHYPDGVTTPPAPPAVTQEDLTKETLLSKQLKEANLKIAGLEMLIETARKELGIDIAKKHGTKQSSK